jgi:hypothetical protein
MKGVHIEQSGIGQADDPRGRADVLFEHSQILAHRHLESPNEPRSELEHDHRHAVNRMKSTTSPHPNQAKNSGILHSTYSKHPKTKGKTSMQRNQPIVQAVPPGRASDAHYVVMHRPK